MFDAAKFLGQNSGARTPAGKALAQVATGNYKNAILKNSKLNFRRPKIFGTEICGPHPGGMGTGKGRGRKFEVLF